MLLFNLKPVAGKARGAAANAAEPRLLQRKRFASICLNLRTHSHLFDGSIEQFSSKREVIWCIGCAGLTPLQHVLAPRARGVELVVRHMGPALDAFYDVTLAYVPGDGSWCPSASASATTSETTSSDNNGRRTGGPLPLAARPPPPNTSTWFHRPVDLHVHIARLELPREEARDHSALQHWLHDRYVQKDKYLHCSSPAPNCCS